MDDTQQGPPKGEAIFVGLGGKIKAAKPYPAWRYHELYEPIIVNNWKEDKRAKEKGWNPPEEFITALPRLSNFFHDLEDFNERQLILYAREEFGVNFPPQATKEMLIKAIWHLYLDAPKHQGRMILLAQSINMNYDETVKEIQRLAEDPDKIEESRYVWL